jgi:hypothetical protein
MLLGAIIATVAYDVGGLSPWSKRGSLHLAEREPDKTLRPWSAGC